MSRLLPTHSISLWHTTFSPWTQRHIRLLRALPGLVATALWLIMLLYFAIWYTTQTKVPSPIPPHGLTIPKPCHSFSLWPYVSCIGQHQYQAFRGVCISMALLISYSCILLTYKSEPIEPGQWARRISALFAVISSVALIAVSYEGIDEMPLAHLITASGQIFSMFICKCFDWAGNLAVRRAWGRRMGKKSRVRVLEVTRWWKIGVGAFCIGPAIFTMLGIYGCQDAAVIADQASTCNKLVVLSEIAEWELSIGWVAYICSISYDLYHIDTVVWIWRNVGVDGGSGDEKEIEKKGHIQSLLPANSTYKSPLEQGIERVKGV
ncbi:hypothetical protein FB567DRAFT_252941 [Paraphoma chrysanthemicola]|uniref:CWH43-like N-terminal domain-containing protein n=1 Tax=Paraphoma chrysanthemicola TaxID=798071 RepID=A0A8K0VRJ5_9PLEO|nr:hypothetical protein FB567DRAFT_252941 [Paraphoma chrysanthemicola]